MLPWGHAAFGYLAYSLYQRLKNGVPPAGWAAIALGLGTQFPDLVDKPLSWTFHVLPTGRSLAHSTLTMAVVGAVLLGVAHRRGWTVPAWAFLAGYASHILGDGLHAIWHGEFHELHYMVYPLLPLGEPESDYSFISFFLNLEFSPFLAFGLVLTSIGLAVWYRDGLPGLAQLRWGLLRLWPGRSPHDDT